MRWSDNGMKVVRRVLQVLKVVFCVLLEVVDNFAGGGEVTRRVLLCVLEAVEWRTFMCCSCLEVVFHVLQILEGLVVLLCVLEAVESVRYVLELLEVMRCVVEVVDGMRRVCWLVQESM
jgi:hypothetical protein